MVGRGQQVFVFGSHQDLLITRPTAKWEQREQRTGVPGGAMRIFFVEARVGDGMYLCTDKFGNLSKS